MTTNTSFLNTWAEITRCCIFRLSNKTHYIEWCKRMVELGDEWTQTVPDNGNGFSIMAKTIDGETWYIITDNTTQTLYQLRKQSYHAK